MCGLPDEAHHSRPSLLNEKAGRSPMFHLEDYCPFVSGNCKENCSTKMAHMRPCVNSAIIRKRKEEVPDKVPFEQWVREREEGKRGLL